MLKLSDLCTQQEEEEDDDGMDPTIVLDALLSLPNLHTRSEVRRREPLCRSTEISRKGSLTADAKAKRQSDVFGRYITELDLSDLCTQQEEEEDDDGMDPTIVLDAARTRHP
jgi:uncharacterized protein (DUF2237 family)